MKIFVWHSDVKVPPRTEGSKTSGYLKHSQHTDEKLQIREVRALVKNQTS